MRRIGLATCRTLLRIARVESTARNAHRIQETCRIAAHGSRVPTPSGRTTGDRLGRIGLWLLGKGSTRRNSIRRRCPINELKSVFRWALGSLGALALIIGGYAAFRAVGLSSSWASVDRVALGTTTTTTTATTTRVPATTSNLDPALERTATERGRATSTSDPTTSTTTTTSTIRTTTSTTIPGRQLVEQAGSAPTVMALIGSDSRAGLEDTGDFGDFPGRRADVILLAIRAGDRISLLSVPRDLYVTDSCRGGRHRISEALQGCGDTGALAHLAHELENLTGLDIQHLAAVDLAGFQAVVDALGGYEICTDHPLRDSKSGLSLDVGCTMADGETTLQWLRSRHTERLVKGTWKKVPGVSDLTRNTRQRKFLIDVFRRVVQREDPRTILDIVETVAPHLTIDDQLTLADAASWLWAARSSQIETAEIPVTYGRSDQGGSVLLPAVDVEDFASGITS